MRLEFDNNIPIYIQLVEQLKIWIISGSIKSGERLPSVRELALQIKVNPNTVQKALTELENLGLVYTKRTNDKFVTDDMDLIENKRGEYIEKLSYRYFADIEKIGINRLEVIDYLNKLGGDK